MVLHFEVESTLNVQESLLVSMYEKARASGYNNLVEQGYPKRENDVEWATCILNNPSIQEQLATKGGAADYVIGEIVSVAKKILQAAEEHER
jgi:hypothetical protein